MKAVNSKPRAQCKDSQHTMVLMSLNTEQVRRDFLVAIVILTCYALNVC